MFPQKIYAQFLTNLQVDRTHPHFTDAYFILRLIDAYDDVYASGGYLHILLEDGNYDDASVQFCKENAKQHQDTYGELICDKLQLFTEVEREWLLTRSYESNDLCNYPSYYEMDQINKI